jgi:hypothetical protein
MPSRKRVFQMATAALVLAGGLAAAAIYFRPSTQKPPAARKPAPQANRRPPARTPAKKDSAAIRTTVSKDKQPGAADQRPGPSKQSSPREVVEAACRLYFGPEVRLTAVSLDKGALTLEGTITKHRQMQDAREVAVKALEEAGFGPIPSDKVINLLRKPPKE